MTTDEATTFATDVEFWIKVITFLIAVGGLIYTFFSNRRKDADHKVEALEAAQNKKFEIVNERLHTGSKRMDGHDVQIQRLHLTVDNMPTKDDLHRLELAMGQMAGNQKEMKALLQGHRDIMDRVNTVLTRQEDHLLSAGKN